MSYDKYSNKSLSNQEFTARNTSNSAPYARNSSIKDAHASSGYKDGRKKVPRAAYEPIMPKQLDPKRGDALRRKWLIVVTIFTWWIPGFMLKLFGKKLAEARQAWREKCTIFTLIMLVTAFVLFFVVFSGPVICSRSTYMSPDDMKARSTTTAGKKMKVYASMFGNVYDIASLVNSVPQHDAWTFSTLAGMDLSSGFLRLPSDYCPELSRNPSFRLAASSDVTNIMLSNHQKMSDSQGQSLNTFLKSKAKYIPAFLPSLVARGWTAPDDGTAVNRIIVNNVVYDLSGYYAGLKVGGATADPFLNISFQVTANAPTFQLDTYISGKAMQGVVDFTSDPVFMALWNGSPALRQCFVGLFVNGVVDDRETLKCKFPDYILLGVSVILMAILGVKFLAAIFAPGAKKLPGTVKRFVAVLLPCYTEDEPTMRATINSIAEQNYDNGYTLIMVVCDGMVVGKDSDRPTSEIVLDIFGVNRSEGEPQAFAYQAVGAGKNQVNRARIYSGFYEHKGNLVAYMVVVKIGNESETERHGNRGKRDSQLVAMRFFNKIHNKHAMSPMELEMRHQIQQRIRVNPAWYEYILMMDSDTTLHPMALPQLVASFMGDTKMSGCCGETKLRNDKSSFVTMIQVYEYFISHNLAKVFESLFGTVTCLPGCFSMYRIFSSEKSRPVIADDAIVQEYADVNYNTLHEKNLLSLGEDRYLTTLLLKHFSQMTTRYVPSALAFTLAPDSFAVLLSQRRRWINSTVHNLVELLQLRNLCGFCCVSMRFIIFLDLIATVIQPAVIVYLVYLLYQVINSAVNGDALSIYMMSFIMLGLVYGLQAIIYILKREFSQIMWMIIYLLALPVFGFFIPIYSFWNMDNFSWGSTRRLNKNATNQLNIDPIKFDSELPVAGLGEEGKKSSLTTAIPISNIEDDDPSFNLAAAIPHQHWEVYLAQRAEKGKY